MAERRGSRKRTRGTASRRRGGSSARGGSLPQQGSARVAPNRQGIAVPCAICGHRGRGEARVRFLPHGLHVWLCAVHGKVAFLVRDGGREFARRIQRRWQSDGEFGTRRRLALTAHLERIQHLGGAGDKPGSHSWPQLRRDAEHRFAAGDDPATVIRDLRLDISGGPAVAPSLRSFRRWFAEGRWLLPPPPTPTAHPVPPQMPTPRAPARSTHTHLQRE